MKFLDIDISVKITNHARLCMSKVAEFCLENKKNLHVSAFGYYVPNLHKHSLNLKLCWIWQKCMDFAQCLTRTCNESSSSDNLHTELVQTKFIMSTLCLDNYHQFLTADWSLGSMCPDLAESNSRQACVSVGQFSEILLRYAIFCNAVDTE